MNCPVTCGRPTRGSAEAFARMCAARKDYGNGMCVACGGRPESWPDELTTIEGGKAMAKTVKEQIAEALRPLQQELEERLRQIKQLEAEAERMEADRVKMMDLIQEQQATNDDLSTEAETQAARIRELTAELAALRAAEAEQVGITGVDVLDMSANLYRDALADFAIRVLSGGVAVSFHEARP